MIEPIVIAIGLIGLVPVWIMGVLTIVFLARKGYASLKEKDSFERIVR